jgi:hypothetical protein
MNRKGVMKTPRQIVQVAILEIEDAERRES